MKKKKKKQSSKAKPKAKIKVGKAKKAKARATPKKAKRKARPAGAAKKPQPAKEKTTVIAPPNSVLAGRVEDYYAKIGVMALTLRSDLKLGDHLHILGHTTHLEQTVDSMQIDHQPVSEAHAKEAVGIKAAARVRRRDHVFLIRG